jgi:hypothetical protein
MGTDFFFHDPWKSERPVVNLFIFRASRPSLLASLLYSVLAFRKRRIVVPKASPVLTSTLHERNEEVGAPLATGIKVDSEGGEID